MMYRFLVNTQSDVWTVYMGACWGGRGTRDPQSRKKCISSLSPTLCGFDPPGDAIWSLPTRKSCSTFSFSICMQQTQSEDDRAYSHSTCDWVQQRSHVLHLIANPQTSESWGLAAQWIMVRGESLFPSAHGRKDFFLLLQNYASFRHKIQMLPRLPREYVANH